MKRKLITFFLAILTIGSLVAFDYIRAGMFIIEPIEISPNPSVADGQSPVEIKLKLTNKSGKPIEGHSLFAFPRNGGTFVANREITNEDGIVNYTYYPYKASTVTDLKDIIIDVVDESNSIVFEVNTKSSFVLKLVAPEEEESDNFDLNDIFGE